MLASCNCVAMNAMSATPMIYRPGARWPRHQGKDVKEQQHFIKRPTSEIHDMAVAAILMQNLDSIIPQAPNDERPQSRSNIQLGRHDLKTSTDHSFHIFKSRNSFTTPICSPYRPHLSEAGSRRLFFRPIENSLALERGGRL